MSNDHYLKILSKENRELKKVLTAVLSKLKKDNDIYEFFRSASKETSIPLMDFHRCMLESNPKSSINDYLSFAFVEAMHDHLNKKESSDSCSR